MRATLLLPHTLTHSRVHLTCLLSVGSMGLKRMRSALVVREEADVEELKLATLHEVEGLARSIGVEHRVNGNSVIFKHCGMLQCDKDNKHMGDKQWKLYVYANGSYFCHRCTKYGKWADLQKDAQNGSQSSSSVQQLLSSKPKNFELLRQKDAIAPHKKLFSNTNSPDMTEDAASVLNWMRGRGLQEEVLRCYGVGYAKHYFSDSSPQGGTHELCVTFPWILPRKMIPEQHLTEYNSVDGQYVHVRYKARALQEKKMKLYPAGGRWGLFGLHCVPENCEQIVLTEGECDALAVGQVLMQHYKKEVLEPTIVAISLPNGCTSLPADILPLLERFSRIYLWMDNDKPGRDGAEKFAHKLGVGRCYIVRPDPSLEKPPKDANEALLQGVDIMKMILNAKPLNSNDIQTFEDLKDDVRTSLLSPHENEGTKTSSLPGLNSICKGFRSGELVVFTGPTGAGKTTLLSQLTLDFAQERRPVLWGSFEIKNVRLMCKMLQQYVQMDLTKCSTEQFDSAFQQFSNLPLRFMNFHGGTDIQTVINAMDHAISEYGVQHIVVDNLQFMMNRNYAQLDGAMKFDKFDRQDEIIDELRKYATRRGVNIILVIHPKKEDESFKLKLSSIFGTAKATQEADVVLCLQKQSNVKSLEVLKNRYDGCLGTVYLAFNEASAKFEETAAPQRKAFPERGQYQNR